MTRLVIARRVEWWRTQRCDKLPDIFCCLHFDRHRIVFPVVHSPSCRPPHSAISRPFCLCVCGVLSHSLWAITHIYNSLAALCRHCKHLQNRARSNGKRHRHRSARSLPAPCVGVRYIYFFFCCSHSHHQYQHHHRHHRHHHHHQSHCAHHQMPQRHTQTYILYTQTLCTKR